MRNEEVEIRLEEWRNGKLIKQHARIYMKPLPDEIWQAYLKAKEEAIK